MTNITARVSKDFPLRIAELADQLADPQNRAAALAEMLKIAEQMAAATPEDANGRKCRSTGFKTWCKDRGNWILSADYRMVSAEKKFLKAFDVWLSRNVNHSAWDDNDRREWAKAYTDALCEVLTKRWLARHHEES